MHEDRTSSVLQPLRRLFIYIARPRLLAVLGALTAVVLSLHLSLSIPGQAATSITVGRADLHLDGDLQIAVSVSQTGTDCGKVPGPGQACLRYSIVDETQEQAVADGYGLIPATGLTISPSSITVTTDTSAAGNPGFHRQIGAGGPISLSWQAHPGGSSVVSGGKTFTLSSAAVQGSVLGHTLGTQLSAGLLISSG